MGSRARRAAWVYGVLAVFALAAVVAVVSMGSGRVRYGVLPAFGSADPALLFSSSLLWSLDLVNSVCLDRVIISFVLSARGLKVHSSVAV